MNNNTWGTLEGTKNSTTPFDLDMIQRVLDSVTKKSLKDCNILDYGSGEGRILSALIDHDLAVPSKVIGCDISHEIVARCQKEHPNFADRVKTILPGETGLSSDSIDFAMFMGVGVCTISDSDFRNAIREIYRVLTDGGILYVTDFLWTPSMEETYKTYHSEHRDTNYGVYQNKDGMKFIHRQPQDLILDYTRVGFLPIESQLITITSINGHQYNGIKLALTK